MGCATCLYKSVLSFSLLTYGVQNCIHICGCSCCGYITDMLFIGNGTWVKTQLDTVKYGSIGFTPLLGLARQPWWDQLSINATSHIDLRYVDSDIIIFYTLNHFNSKLRVIFLFCNSRLLLIFWQLKLISDPMKVHKKVVNKYTRDVIIDSDSESIPIQFSLFCEF